jgi:methionyl-tRNA formyltransferase
MRYVFIGNRKFVLEEMLKKKLKVAILVIKGSHLERDNILKNKDFSLITSKQNLMEKLGEITYDILISNGCPYILPIAKMEDKLFVNIHPSFLPDLRGVDPVLGAILHKRDSGATCHLMNNKIDSGDIISRVKIPYSNDLDISLLYQLSFIAEKKVFLEGYKKSFHPSFPQENKKDLIYYSRKEEDQFISFEETNELIISKIKTFSNLSQGCFFIYRNYTFKVFSVNIIMNEFFKKESLKQINLEILLCYEDCIIFKKDNQIIKLSKINGPMEKIVVGSFINEKDNA